MFSKLTKEERYNLNYVDFEKLIKDPNELVAVLFWNVKRVKILEMESQVKIADDAPVAILFKKVIFSIVKELIPSRAANAGAVLAVFSSKVIRVKEAKDLAPIAPPKLEGTLFKVKKESTIVML